ncbi:MAG: hypothetical protein IH898_09140 [Planctomycetes bacterium]|nr:hypothetical protein [Planctomycetota bacterium]
MHHGTQTTTRYALILFGIYLCCCSPAVLHAQDDDGNLVPGDSNDFVVLADLLTGPVTNVTVGDKVFSMFSYSSAGDMPAATEINVFGFQDPDDNFGLTLQGAFLDNPGDPNGSSATLEFDVTVSDEGQQLKRVISDAHLFLGGSGVPADSEISVDESFQNASETLQVFSSTIGGQSANQLSDWVDFSETATSRQVTALLSALTAEEANLPARASAIDLSFSQVIPEPSAALLLMCAGVAFGAGRFRARLPL